MQRELSIISSCVSAARLFIAPFPSSDAASFADKQPDATSTPKSFGSPQSFGSWFLDPMQRSASAGSDSAGSARVEWDDVLSANPIASSPIQLAADDNAGAGHSSNVAPAIVSAYTAEYSAERPFAFNHQLHTLPQVSLQELLASLNVFSSWLQTASCKDVDGSGGHKYADMPGICDDVLRLYLVIFGFDSFVWDCMYLVSGDVELQLSAIFSMKPSEPTSHVTSIGQLQVYQRNVLSRSLCRLWRHHYEATGWLPSLSIGCAEKVLLPALSQILELSMHTSTDVMQQCQFSLTSLIMRTGPCALAQVAITSLDRLADVAASQDHMLITVQILRAVAPACFRDWTLLEALCHVLLACRTRVDMRADVENSLDGLWLVFARLRGWSHLDIVPTVTREMLTPRTQAMMPSNAATSPQRIQDATISIMTKE